ncbi:MAG: exo-alpha-sialidase, partial [Actinomycetaceae bacterium]|nr:exo-alpha-sialidase [Actinomycetaceae bacterium]
MRQLISLLAMLVVSTAASAQTPTCDSAQYLFITPDAYNVPYRIPAITTTRKGALIAVSDRRYCGSDIGFGRIDIVARTSRDNGRTWSPDTVIQRGSGIEGSDNCGYGDAAIVADRTS